MVRAVAVAAFAPRLDLAQTGEGGPEVAAEDLPCAGHTVGIGCYRIDLHPSTGGDPYIDLGCCPFQIPLGALLPVRMENLLPGGKNIGTTHITNGAYRRPPVEWNVGEVAGHLAAFCAGNRLVPRQVRATPALLERFQARLAAAGVEVAWPVIAGY